MLRQSRTFRSSEMDRQKMNIVKDISSFIGTTESSLLNIIHHSDQFYKTFAIDKKNGEKRIIDAPNLELKAIQTYILRYILERKNFEISCYAKGFIKKKGIKDNAKIHLNKKFLMCLDIKEFFPSIKFHQVYNNFINNYDPKNSQYLTDLCTLSGYLPQGAVTSPFISNVVFKPIDDLIAKISLEDDIIYSRYADDLIFSSNEIIALQKLYPEIENIINKYDFILNNEKTRFLSKKRRQMVTGIILNSGRMTIGRENKRKISKGILIS